MSTSSSRCLQIISALASTESPLEKAERCLTNYNQSIQKGTRRTLDGSHVINQHWVTELINVLCNEEPIIEKDKLTFVPKISQLPVDVQRNILAFLVHHAADIPTHNLANLLSTLKTFQHQDDWCDFHISTLLQMCNQRTGQLINQERTGQSMSCQWKVTKTTNESFNNVCKQLLDASSSKTTLKRCKLQFDWLPKLVSHNLGKNLTNHDPLQNSETTCVVHNCIEITGPHKNVKRSAQQMEIGNKRPHLQPSELNSANPLDEMAIDDLFPVDNVLLPEGVSKVNRISSEISQQVDSSNGTPIIATSDEVKSLKDEPRASSSEIDETLKSHLDVLKNELVTCSARSALSEVAQETTKLILHSHVEVASDLWNQVGIEDVTPVGLECLCHFVVQSIGPAELSYKAAHTMASKCFLKKLSATANNRALESTILTFAKAFPKPTIDGVVLPYITNENAAVTQCDLVAKLTKDILTNEQKIYLLNGLLRSEMAKWGEHHTSLVQSSLINKLELDQKSLSTLVTSLVHHGISQNSCKKFAKLLLCVINQYGKKYLDTMTLEDSDICELLSACVTNLLTASLTLNEMMTATDVTSLQSIVTANKTFLKKAALNALKKIQLT